MAKAADIGSKRLISLAKTGWVQWVKQNPDIVAGEFLDSQFQWLSRESDVLVKANSREHRDFLVLNEIQLNYQVRMPKRMRAYAALAEEKYNLPVYPVLINIRQPSETVVVARYDSEFMGLRSRQDYRVINRWEVDAELAFQPSLRSLLPFVPMLRGGSEESVVRRAVQRLRDDEQLKELEPLLAFFAGFVLETRLVQQIMRWDIAVLRESPWYQEIIREGQQLGMQQGMLSGIELALELKFGNEGLQLMPEISNIQDVERLKAIAQAIKTVNSLDELRSRITAS
ncbi:hypothetical protein NDI37_14920 [Funiculus sociatus GB2-A5]|uniref:Transposase n=1 Tax=Funiculus sociatus GB2-A5 TaxID=2933946 RepID=A0ABV0JSV2_9CYAN|nr:MULTISPECIES: Rpn family recombination-promoting nuclease/putative transposase [unclassified Trichocoleus]MBD1906727.1 Rpn family recombination-promoting nuclease/putative transposase [Trichocoleus sp. FACHB-832]MBD2063164.1 Rpn family recombination-promoting nuclease/putative transposase [Trichocoleus sp. FACHB-6]